MVPLQLLLLTAFLIPLLVAQQNALSNQLNAAARARARNLRARARANTAARNLASASRGLPRQPQGGLRPLYPRRQHQVRSAGPFHAPEPADDTVAFFGSRFAEEGGWGLEEEAATGGNIGEGMVGQQRQVEDRPDMGVQRAKEQTVIKNNEPMLGQKWILDAREAVNTDTRGFNRWGVVKNTPNQPENVVQELGNRAKQALEEPKAVQQTVDNKPQFNLDPKTRPLPGNQQQFRNNAMDNWAVNNDNVGSNVREPEVQARKASPGYVCPYAAARRAAMERAPQQVPTQGPHFESVMRSMHDFQEHPEVWEVHSSESDDHDHLLFTPLHLGEEEGHHEEENARFASLLDLKEKKLELLLKKTRFLKELKNKLKAKLLPEYVPYAQPYSDIPSYDSDYSYGGGSYDSYVGAEAPSDSAKDNEFADSLLFKSDQQPSEGVDEEGNQREASPTFHKYKKTKYYHPNHPHYHHQHHKYKGQYHHGYGREADTNLQEPAPSQFFQVSEITPGVTRGISDMSTTLQNGISTTTTGVNSAISGIASGADQHLVRPIAQSVDPLANRFGGNTALLPTVPPHFPQEPHTGGSGHIPQEPHTGGSGHIPQEPHTGGSGFLSNAFADHHHQHHHHRGGLHDKGHTGVLKHFIKDHIESGHPFKIHRPHLGHLIEFDSRNSENNKKDFTETDAKKQLADMYGQQQKGSDGPPLGTFSSLWMHPKGQDKVAEEEANKFLMRYYAGDMGEDSTEDSDTPSRAVEIPQEKASQTQQILTAPAQMIPIQTMSRGMPFQSNVATMTFDQFGRPIPIQTSFVPTAMVQPGFVTPMAMTSGFFREAENETPENGNNKQRFRDSGRPDVMNVDTRTRASSRTVADTTRPQAVVKDTSNRRTSNSPGIAQFAGNMQQVSGTSRSSSRTVDTTRLQSPTLDGSNRNNPTRVPISSKQNLPSFSSSAPSSIIVQAPTTDNDGLTQIPTQNSPSLTRTTHGNIAERVGLVNSQKGALNHIKAKLPTFPKHTVVQLQGGPSIVNEQIPVHNVHQRPAAVITSVTNGAFVPGAISRIHTDISNTGIARQAEMENNGEIQQAPGLSMEPSGQIPDGQSPDGQIPDGLNPGDQIPDGQIPDGQILDGQIPGGQIPGGEILDGQIPDGQIPNGQISGGQMPDGQILDGQIPDGQIPNGQIPEGPIPDGPIPDGQIPDGIQQVQNEDEMGNMEVINMNDVEMVKDSAEELPVSMQSSEAFLPISQDGAPQVSNIIDLNNPPKDDVESQPPLESIEIPNMPPENQPVEDPANFDAQPIQNTRTIEEDIMQNARTIQEDMMQNARTIEGDMMQNAKTIEDMMQNARTIGEDMIQNAGTIEEGMMQNARTTEEDGMQNARTAVVRNNPPATAEEFAKSLQDLELANKNGHVPDFGKTPPLVFPEIKPLDPEWHQKLLDVASTGRRNNKDTLRTDFKQTNFNPEDVTDFPEIRQKKLLKKLHENARTPEDLEQPDGMQKMQTNSMDDVSFRSIQLNSLSPEMKQKLHDALAMENARANRNILMVDKVDLHNAPMVFPDFTKMKNQKKSKPVVRTTQDLENGKRALNVPSEEIPQNSKQILGQDDGGLALKSLTPQRRHAAITNGNQAMDLTENQNDKRKIDFPRANKNYRRKIDILPQNTQTEDLTPQSDNTAPKIQRIQHTQRQIPLNRNPVKPRNVGAYNPHIRLTNTNTQKVGISDQIPISGLDDKVVTQPRSSYTDESDTLDEVEILRKPSLFEFPQQRESYVNSQYYRGSRHVKHTPQGLDCNNKRDKRSLEDYDAEMLEDASEKQDILNDNMNVLLKRGDLLLTATNITEAMVDVLSKAKDNPAVKREVRRRAIELSRILTDPNLNVNIPKTIDNLGIAAKNVVEDEKAPLYHLRNLVGSGKNALMSLMRIPPQNLVIPSNYKIEKLQDDDSIGQALNPSDEHTGAINPDFYLRFKEGSEEVPDEFIEADTQADRVDDTLLIADTLSRLGAIMRESVKSGQDTIRHVGEMAQDTKNLVHATKNITPRIVEASGLGTVRSAGPKARKTVIIAPRIVELEPTLGYRRNEVEDRPDYVRLGEILDALGVSKPNAPDLGLHKLTVESVDKPVPIVKATLDHLDETSFEDEPLQASEPRQDNEELSSLIKALYTATRSTRQRLEKLLHKFERKRSERKKAMKNKPLVKVSEPVVNESHFENARQYEDTDRNSNNVFSLKTFGKPIDDVTSKEMEDYIYKLLINKQNQESRSSKRPKYEESSNQYDSYLTETSNTAKEPFLDERNVGLDPKDIPKNDYSNLIFKESLLGDEMNDEDHREFHSISSAQEPTIPEEYIRRKRSMLESEKEGELDLSRLYHGITKPERKENEYDVYQQQEHGSENDDQNQNRTTGNFDKQVKYIAGVIEDFVSKLLGIDKNENEKGSMQTQDNSQAFGISKESVSNTMNLVKSVVSKYSKPDNYKVNKDYFSNTIEKDEANNIDDSASEESAKTSLNYNKYKALLGTQMEEETQSNPKVSAPKWLMKRDSKEVETELHQVADELKNFVFHALKNATTKMGIKFADASKILPSFVATTSLPDSTTENTMMGKASKYLSSFLTETTTKIPKDGKSTMEALNKASQYLSSLFADTIPNDTKTAMENAAISKASEYLSSFLTKSFTGIPKDSKTVMENNAINKASNYISSFLTDSLTTRLSDDKTNTETLERNKRSADNYDYSWEDVDPYERAFSEQNSIRKHKTYEKSQKTSETQFESLLDEVREFLADIMEDAKERIDRHPIQRIKRAENPHNHVVLHNHEPVTPVSSEELKKHVPEFSMEDDDLLLTHLASHEHFPTDEEMDHIIGMSFIQGPGILEPFMGRAHEEDVNAYVREVQSRHSEPEGHGKHPEDRQRRPLKDSDEKHPEDLEGPELDHVLGAINPLMFEERFNETLAAKNDSNQAIEQQVEPKGWTEVHQGDQQVVGTMQMSDTILKPFMGLASQEEVQEMLASYNPQEFDISDVGEEMID